MSSSGSQEWAMASILQGENQITNIDFHADGNYLISASKEGTILLIDSLTGQEKKKIFTKSHGIGVAKYTHHDACLLLSSEKKSNELRYLCMHDNRYLRLFKGHTDKVTSLSMSPISDSFISASNDKNVFLWSLDNPNPVARLQLPPEVQFPYVAYDSSGLVFGVMGRDTHKKEQSLKLFDSRNYAAGPFQEIAPTRETISSSISQGQTQRLLESVWTDFQFSPDGSKVLVNTNSEFCMIIDGFERSVAPTVLSNRKNESGLILGACYSQDGSAVYTGNDDNEIQIYSTATGSVTSYLSGHVTPVRALQCNPKYEVMASGCLNTVLWLRKE